MKKKKAKRVNKQEMVNELRTKRVERTRVVGDMLGYEDSSETYQALNKRLDDLNETIMQITKDLNRVGMMV